MVGPTEVSPPTQAGSGAGKSSAATGRTAMPSSKAPATGAPIGPQGRTQLGDFRLIKKLGQGGMGEVFLAHQLSLDRPAALKVLAKHLADNPEFVKRFYREARAMAKLDHPQAVRAFAVDEDDGIHYVAMEFVDGKSLQDWQKQFGRLSVGDTLHIVLRCAETLEQAHSVQMVHRDIKPDNIMLTRRGQVKVADFGLAKALDDDDMSMTQSGTGLGTPYYMAPEQARNAKHVDGRSDIYALGITLYHCLTGKLPFTGNSAMEVVLAKEKGNFPSIRKLNPEVPERLELILDKMIAKDPAQRFQDCGELIRLLNGLNLASPSLSFIDAPDKVTVTGSSRSAAPGAPTRKLVPGDATAAMSGRHAVPNTTAAGKTTTETQWSVEFQKPNGDKTISRWGTSQVLNALRSGVIDNRAKVKKDGTSSFVPIAQYPDFAQTVQGLLIKQQADKKGGETKKLLNNYARQESYYKLKKGARGLFSSVMGLVSLVAYLAIIGGALYGGYWFWQQQQVKSTTPAATAPAASTTPPAGN